MSDYIKIKRSILEWEWYKNINTCRLFIHMLLKANWKDGKFQGKTIERGSFISSLKKLAEETQLTENEVRTAIRHLKMTGELTSKAHNKYTIFTVVNYDKYQANDKQTDKQPTNNEQTNNNLMTTIEEKKELEEGKKNNSNYQEIITLYNTLCVSYPRLTRLSDKRMKALKARINHGYTIKDFKELFLKAESSAFLKGKNKKNWSATFDWLIADGNMAKVLDGNYDNHRENGGNNPDESGRNNSKNTGGFTAYALEQGFDTEFDGF